MADSENKDLMKFLEKKFDGIEKQFEGVYKRLDNNANKDDLDIKIVAAKEETMRHTGVLIENVHHKLDLIIEGLMGVNERRDRDKKENDQEHSRLEKMTLINTADISKLDQRVGKLEGRV
jgi:hypothetical protein